MIVIDKVMNERIQAEPSAIGAGDYTATIFAGLKHDPGGRKGGMHGWAGSRHAQVVCS